MAEAEKEIAPAAAEAEEREHTDQTEVPVEKTGDENPAAATSEETITERTNEIPAAEESAPAAEENSSTPEQEEADMQEVAEEKPTIKIETAPADFRFPTTNQTRHCFTRYVEYHRCIAAKGEDASECDKFAKYYRSLCPTEWVERWNEQRENGTFPGPLKKTFAAKKYP